MPLNHAWAWENFYKNTPWNERTAPCPQWKAVAFAEIFPGGSFGFDFAGTYTKIIQNELIEYDFFDRSASVEFMQIKASIPSQALS